MDLAVASAIATFLVTTMIQRMEARSILRQENPQEGTAVKQTVFQNTCLALPLQLQNRTTSGIYANAVFGVPRLFSLVSMHRAQTTTPHTSNDEEAENP